jgi:hypothetical protein
LTTWDVYTRRLAPAPGMLAQLDRLRAALPSYDVTLTSHSGSYRFEAVRRTEGPGPWCLISADPADLWRELTPWTRHGASTGQPADRELADKILAIPDAPPAGEIRR